MGKPVFVVGSICLVLCVGVLAGGVVLVLTGHHRQQDNNDDYHADNTSTRLFTGGLLMIVFSSIGILALCVSWWLKTRTVQNRNTSIDTRALMDTAFGPVTVPIEMMPTAPTISV